MGETARYRFTCGPWNIHPGADPFGPPVRPEVAFDDKLRLIKAAGMDGIQFHDDDVCPADWDWPTTQKAVRDVRKKLDDLGLFVEIIAPRLWEDARTIDGAYSANDPQARRYALERSKRCIDIGNMLGCRNVVLWLAREGTYIREAKDPIASVGRILDAVNALLEYDKNIRILGEMKPNEPMDQAYLPTPGHFLGLAYRTSDPSRVGVLIESAHSILAGLDPADDMAYALWHGKLWSVHLNDQNGLKYDQDKTFGSVDLRRAFNIVWVLERGGYGTRGECVGLDVKAMRTTTPDRQTQHLINSRDMFLRLVEVARRLDEKIVEDFRARRDYESLELYILRLLMGRD
ncbi:MAG: xylose isomerase [Gemmataceae bacterium]